MAAKMAIDCRRHGGIQRRAEFYHPQIDAQDLQQRRAFNWLDKFVVSSVHSGLTANFTSDTPPSKNICCLVAYVRGCASVRSL
jgi:hypothetical protein